MTFTTAAFDRSSSWQFEASSYTATPRGHPSSLLQHDARASSWHNQTRTSSLGAARPLPPSADIGPGGQSVGQAAQFCL